mmetsp:Transcript_19345/g.74288  ORF Transcript_19345/g.74288 Transcript_19345/m.74288 type:complete len:255 (+) Transcript_19345:212-976(+)
MKRRCTLPPFGKSTFSAATPCAPSAGSSGRRCRASAAVRSAAVAWFRTSSAALSVSKRCCSALSSCRRSAARALLNSSFCCSRSSSASDCCRVLLCAASICGWKRSSTFMASTSSSSGPSSPWRTRNTPIELEPGVWPTTTSSGYSSTPRASLKKPSKFGSMEPSHTTKWSSRNADVPVPASVPQQKGIVWTWSAWCRYSSSGLSRSRALRTALCTLPTSKRGCTVPYCASYASRKASFTPTSQSSSSRSVIDS